ncbi:hypothetical protein BCR43DRAFT_103903 [Syncephalastrum racemosum]|uniref:tRNA pseudouridine(55) synthase n=1 Tax=Syncephalastrum racemosum TaxID=13706 RepID=A0A1X2H1L0_SYNRA|nr:hypothetical protein BCR43DRAFT_103903 [Syncephalastrum racemosum]
MDIASEIARHKVSRSKKADENEALQDSEKLITTLREAGCCSRCCLRFLACNRLSVYAAPEAELNEHFGIAHSPPSCTACLGTLQSGLPATVAERIASQLEDYEQLDNATYGLVCTLPIGMVSRDYLLKLHVKQPVVMDYRELFRFLVQESLKTLLPGVSPVKADTETIRVDIVLTHDPTDTEHTFLTQAEEPVIRNRKIPKGGRPFETDSRPSILEALKKISYKEACSLTSVPPLVHSERATIASLKVTVASTFVGGRYLKFSRECSQTPWEINGMRLAEHSVSECIGKVLQEAHKARDYKFIPAGREDADVRMLGTGRPMVVELIDPRIISLSPADYTALEKKIAEDPTTGQIVQVKQLTQVDPKRVTEMKEGEEFKRKKYRALVWLSEPVTPEILDRINQQGKTPFIIKQNTPLRVFQRRAAVIREKEIFECTAVAAEANEPDVETKRHFLILSLDTQAGTYIKEFVHGDLGRTQPNLATIAGVKGADLIELDVTEVSLQWP